MQEQDTAYDAIKKEWVSILSNVSLQKQRTFPSMQAGYEGVWTTKKQLRDGHLRPSKSQARCLKTLETT